MDFPILSFRATQHTVRSSAGQTVGLLISHGYGRGQRLAISGSESSVSNLWLGDLGQCAPLP